MSTITIQATNCESNQEWASDPDLIEITFSSCFLELAEKCIEFMKANHINYVCRWFALGYELYRNTDEVFVEGQMVIDMDSQKKLAADGNIYEIFEPQYRVAGCHAEIFADGDIKAILPFKHTDNKLWCSVGNIRDLKLQYSNVKEKLHDVTA